MLTPTLDAVARGCHRRCRRPVRPMAVRRRHHCAATKKGTSHVEQSRAPENTGPVPTTGLVGDVVPAGGESWRPATRNCLC